MMPQTESVNEAYKTLLEAFRRTCPPVLKERNARTGVDIALIEGAVSFKLSLADERLPVPGNRRYCVRLAAAETAWQFAGTRDPDFMTKHAPNLWNKFIEDDGMVHAAYGYRWRHHFNRDQVAMALAALKTDPTNRQVYVSTWDPICDGLGEPNQPKNIPCVTGFSLTCCGNILHMSVFMRSSDVFVGLPYDIMSYALTLDAIAASLGFRPGSLHFTLAHAHIYEPHIKFLQPSLNRAWATDISPALPAWPVDDITQDPDGYLDHVRRLVQRINKVDYDPKPEVVA